MIPYKEDKMHVLKAFVFLCTFHQCYCQHNTARLITMNTGLVEFLPGHRIRREALVRQLRHQPYDVACLQEVWYGNDVRFIVRNSGDPFAFNPLLARSTQPVTNRPCPFAMLGLLWRCAISGVRTIDDIARCAIGQGVFRFQENCIRCVITAGFKAFYRCLPIFRSTPINRSGLLLLSKRSIRRARIVSFEDDRVPLFFRRAYIEADIQGIGPIICTHLTANISNTYFEGNLVHKYRSWEHQNYVEASRLVEATYHLNKVIIMGDINSGPRRLFPLPTEPELPGTYRLFISSRYESPYVDTNGHCTVCEYNPIIPQKYKRNTIVDHIFIRGHNSLTSERVFGSVIPGAGYPVSDHYGVAVTIVVSDSVIYPQSRHPFVRHHSPLPIKIQLQVVPTRLLLK